MSKQGRQVKRGRRESTLRDEAEAALTGSRAPKQATIQTLEQLLQELQVHQVELEMQNDELRRTQLALEESRDRYLSLYEFAPLGYLTITREGLIAEVNLAGAALFGVERRELLKHRFGRFVAPADLDQFGRHVASVLQHDGKLGCDLALRRADGSPFYARLQSMRMETNGEPALVRTAVSDITEGRKAELELRIAAAAFESHEGMIVTDSKGVMLRVNRAFTELTGYSAEEAIGKTPALLKSGRHDAEFYRAMWETLARDKFWHGEIWNRRKDGEVSVCWLTASAVGTADGRITHYVGTFLDITQRKAAEEQIRNLAFYDPLTRLPNRRLLYDRLRQAFSASARTGHMGAVLFIDLDNFKILNDTQGHDAGDQLLIEVSRRLSACVRGVDSVARLGGDEFVVILEGLSENTRTAARPGRGGRRENP